MSPARRIVVVIALGGVLVALGYLLWPSEEPVVASPEARPATASEPHRPAAPQAARRDELPPVRPRPTDSAVLPNGMTAALHADPARVGTGERLGVVLELFDAEGQAVAGRHNLQAVGRLGDEPPRAVEILEEDPDVPGRYTAAWRAHTDTDAVFHVTVIVTEDPLTNRPGPAVSVGVAVPVSAGP